MGGLGIDLSNIGNAIITMSLQIIHPIHLNRYFKLNIMGSSLPIVSVARLLMLFYKGRRQNKS